MVDLPQQVRAGKNEHEEDAGEGFAPKKQSTARLRHEQGKGEGGEEEGHGRLVEQTQTSGEANEEP